MITVASLGNCSYIIYYKSCTHGTFFFLRVFSDGVFRRVCLLILCPLITAYLWYILVLPCRQRLTLLLLMTSISYNSFFFFLFFFLTEVVFHSLIEAFDEGKFCYSTLHLIQYNVQLMLYLCDLSVGLWEAQCCYPFSQKVMFVM